MRYIFRLEGDDLATQREYLAVNAVYPTHGTPMVGDSNYTNASGTDDATALQSILDAAVTSGRIPVVEIPGRRTYRIGSTITIPPGITIRGLGGVSDVGTNQPPTFVWSGSAGGTMFDVYVAAANTPMTTFENIMLMGRTDDTNLPGILLRFRGNGQTSPVDTGTYLKNVWLQNCSSHALSLEDGATNIHIENGRCDDWGGYAINVDCTSSSVSMTIDGNTTFAMGEAADGIIYLNGETSGTSMVKIIGAHLETNASCNQTYAGGTNPFDKRGLIRLGVDASESAVQHHVHCVGLELAEPFSIASHSVFQVTASTTADSDLDNTRMVNITVNGGVGLSRGTTDANANDEIRIIGGRVHASERPTTTASGNIGYFQLALGKNSNGEQIWSWANSRGFFLRNPVTETTTVAQLPTDFPKQGMRGFVSDSNATLASGHGNTVAGGGSNIVPVYYDGTNWKIG